MLSLPLTMVTLYLVVVFCTVMTWEADADVYIESKKDCKRMDFVPRSRSYHFNAQKRLECEVPISIPSVYGQYQYCVTVENVVIHGHCPVELRIYEGLTSYRKSPKVTLTCDGTSITSPLCVSGVGNGLFIMYQVFSAPLGSDITLHFTYGDIPKTTTVFTHYDDDSYGSDGSISMFVPLLAIVVVMILCLCVYYCCCKKPTRGEVISEAENRQTAFSDLNRQELEQNPTIPSAPAYNDPPPAYDNFAPLVEPTAPPMTSEDPPSYESVIKNAV